MARAGGLPLPTITEDRALGSAVIGKSLKVDQGTADSDSGSNYSRTFASGNRKTFTISLWVKKCGTPGNIGDGDDSYTIISCGGGGTGSYAGNLRFGTSDQLIWSVNNPAPSVHAKLETTRKFRDPSAWYHIMFVADTTQGTNTNRLKLYVDGVQETDFANTTYPSQDYDLYFNLNVQHRIGSNSIWSDLSRSYGNFNGYFAEFHFVDGQALDPSSFGFTDPKTGVWMPKRYEGTYGTNGFYLDFSDNTSATTLGIDKSPNGNDFTPEDVSVSAGTGNDSLEDTPTNNFCTLNFLDKSNGAKLREGALTLYTSSNDQAATGTFAVASGKWYWEIDMTDAEPEVGIAHDEMPLSNKGTSLPSNGQISFIVAGADGNSNFLRVDGHTQSGTGLSAQSGPGTIGIALDMDSKKIWFSNTSGNYFNSGNPATGVNAAVDFSSTGPNYPTCAVRPIVCMYQGSDKQVSINCGQRPFTYTPPTGFKTLTTKNLPLNVPSIRPQKHFDTILYTGDGSSSKTVSGLEFKPDLVWMKGRTSMNHALVDSVRGRASVLFPNSDSAAQTSSSSQDLVEFNDHGFVVGTPYRASSSNDNGTNIAAWCWKAGGATTVSNSDGSITSSVSANQEAGFSIVTWTGTNGNGTVGHGLGKAPKWVVIRRIDSTSSWVVYHEEVGNTKRLTLDSNATQSSASANWFNNTSPTSTTFSVGSDGGSNGSTDNYVAWCWSEIPNYSKFGKFKGNGNANGPFVHLGFRPALVIVKNLDTVKHWGLFDNKRAGYNVENYGLFPSDVSGEDTDDYIDFLSNGFKIRSTALFFNKSDDNIIYIAFAEQPGATPYVTFPNAR